jgi:hypothetical protein
VLFMREGRIVDDEAAAPSLEGLDAVTRDGLALAALRAGLRPLT